MRTATTASRCCRPASTRSSFELEGFGAPERAVKISASQNTRVDADLSTSSVSEEIVVTGSYETISTTPEAATTYEKEFVESLPVDRNVRETVLLTPGVNDVGPGTNSRLRAITISGAQSFENLFLVNGVVVNENLRGQPLDLFIEDAIEETTTLTSGISAEYGRFQGGVVNTITRSGGNELHGSFRDRHHQQQLGVRDSADAQPDWTRTTSATRPPSAATFCKDRIWYFVAGRDFENINSASTVLTGLTFPAGSDQQRYEGKLTLTPFQGHRLTGSYITVEEEEVGNRFGNILDLRSLVVRSTPQELTAINYNGVVTENFFVEAQYSQREFTFEGSGSRFTRPDLRHPADRQPHRPPLLEPDLLRRLHPGVARQREHPAQGLAVPRQRVAGHARPGLRLRHLQGHPPRQQLPVGQRLPLPAERHDHPQRPALPGVPERPRRRAHPVHPVEPDLHELPWAPTWSPTPTSSTTAGA